ncbi:zinc ribbon domain-containing protein [Aquabacter spiritensis]|uniref:Uncharacterized protein n=1 Tax=Aquabacter spiritensis TaxID=933073 RepID=A0A4R3LMS8_9HYPH|nr:zinc ribbon domain-containing protein [Aquabacter spiritensis]TCT00946.1 hypothetical protein EDC64_12033 [Aquabacter spiritensis]
MGRKPDLCPSCEAPVHPKATECPDCGAALPRRSLLLPVLVGVAGVCVALLAGAAVWIVLGPAGSAPPAPPQVAVAPPPPAPEPVPSAPPAALPPPAAAPQSDSAVQSEPPPAEAPLPLPQVRPGTAGPPADAAARRELARMTQDNFVQNGLDMKVSATGPDSKVMSIVFSFPAKTAVELIVGGPFPRQCRARGFTSIDFVDPSGAAWVYDIATDQLTAK